VRNAWLEAFAAGLKEDAESFGARLIGGDTCRTPGPLVVSITAFGDTGAQDIYLSRKGARPGDAICVSGTIGDAALGLALRTHPAWAARLSAPSRDHLLARYLLPRPRLDLAARLRACASAAMDVSDGLAGDLAKLCRASGVGAVIEAAQVPLSAPAREAIALEPRLLETALTGGDDYEILFTAPASSASFPGVTRIGVATSPAAAPVFRDAAQNTLNFVRPSYRHF
jgi:thiamine-monophosphate kinase